MNIFKHRYLTNFSHYFLRVAFNIPGVVLLVSLIRFIYLIYIKKNHKTLYPIYSKPEVIGFNNKGGDASLQQYTGKLHNNIDNLTQRIMHLEEGSTVVKISPLKL